MSNSTTSSFQYDATSAASVGWPSMDSMYNSGGSGAGSGPVGADPRTSLDLAAAHHAAAMHGNPYAAAAAAVAANIPNNHVSSSGANNVMGGGQVPDVHKRDKDAIYG